MAQGECSDVGVLGVGVFEECVDGHARKVVISLTKVDQVKIYHLLFYQIFSRRRQNHLRKQPTRIHASSRVINDPLNYLLPDKRLILIIKYALEISFEII